MKKSSQRIKKLCFAAMFLALGWLFPFLTGQNRDLGNMLSLIHIPAYLGGMLLGPWYGVLLGFVIPLSRSLILGMPVLYPRALCMAFEMAAYGGICGGMYHWLQKKNKKITTIYISMIPAMLLGRVVWGAGRALCGLFAADAFTWSAFIAGGFVTAWPGMIAQLILVPVMLVALEKTGLLKGGEADEV